MSSKRARVEDYSSDFEDEEDEGARHKREQRYDLADKPGPSRPSAASTLPTKSTFETARAQADSYKYSYLSLNAFERHKKLINDYFLYYPGSKGKLGRDPSKDKNDHDVIRDHHRFIWGDEEDADTWEKQLTKKYYDKLFKEYCISDLSFYKEGKFAMRWRTETEVVNGKGQFICGARKCDNAEGLRTWEVNFAYMEESVKKNALVKLRLCPECSVKLNFHHKNKEVTKEGKIKKKNKKAKRKKETKRKRTKEVGEASDEEVVEGAEAAAPEGQDEESIWKGSAPVEEEKTREEEFEAYLDDLFL